MNDRMRELPAVALRGMTILPGMVAHFDVSRSKSVRAVENAMLGDQQVFLVTQRDVEEEEPGLEGLFRVGIIAAVKQVIKLQHDVVRVLVEGMERAELLQFLEYEEYLRAEVLLLGQDPDPLPAQIADAMVRSLQETLANYAVLSPKTGKELARQALEMRDITRLLDTIGNNIPVSYENKQRILEAVGLEERYETVMAILLNEIQVIQIKNEFQTKVRERVDRNQKEYILREQMKLIRQELGEDTIQADAARFEAQLKKLKAGRDVKETIEKEIGRQELGEDNTQSDADHFLEATGKLKADKAVKEKIKKEIERYKSVGSSSSESAVIRGYIETMLDLPWNKASKDNRDIHRAEQILDEDHYGLEKVKERMLEFLAVRNLTSKGDSPIICLVGPPGTGKTSIAKSVARSLEKKYVRISLGGVRDEAEIRGHRKTYVGAMPGRLVNALKYAGVKNPLILLDEIDKLSSDYKGDTASALLEVLDSEQNHSFRDHYVEVPIDLSEVLFIATANSTQTIPRPLLDRMELIEVSSYTENEKMHIAREHLIDKQLSKNGLKTQQLSISNKALEQLIRGYTREAGVRSLERKIGEVCRKAAREIYTGDKKLVRLTESNLEKYLGKVRYHYDMANESPEVGIVRGLAWTSVGGDTLQIEVNIMPGKGEFSLTGQLGDVMKESAQAGISYIRSVSREYEIEKDFFKEHDIHIHIPEGATPKDGPSAGITMATAMLSAITGRKVRADVAMTGEITLRGRVLPIGGLKEKILAAKNANIKTVCVPKKNEADVAEIAAEIKKGIEIIYVEKMEDVLKAALI